MDEAVALVRELQPPRRGDALPHAGGLNFLDPPDAFLDAMGARPRLETSETDVEPLLGSREEPVVALFAPPRGGGEQVPDYLVLMSLPEAESTYQRPPLCLIAWPFA